MKKIIYVGLIMSICSCFTAKKASQTALKNNTTFELTEVSSDPNYGLTEKNPVQVGGVDKEQGPLNERRYLNALAGPNGEEVSYSRAGSCCPTKSKNDPFGFGQVMLDNDYGTLKAPVGFTLKE